MKRIIIAVLFICFLASCAKSVTPYQAAHGSYKKCKTLR